MFRIGMYYFHHVRRTEISLPRKIKVNIKVKISPAHAMTAYGWGRKYKNGTTHSYVTSEPDQMNGCLQSPKALPPGNNHSTQLFEAE